MEDRLSTHITPEQLIHMKKKSFQVILFGVVIQLILAILAVGICWVFSTQVRTLSMMAGVAVYLVPSLLASMYMLFSLLVSSRNGAYSFILAESLRLCGALSLIGIVVSFARNDIDWLFFCIGLIIILKSNFLILLKS